MTPSPDDRAKQWLSLIDDQNYADAYKQMGPSAQAKTAATAWAQAGQTISVNNGDVAGLISAIQTLNANGGGTIYKVASSTFPRFIVVQNYSAESASTIDILGNLSRYAR